MATSWEAPHPTSWAFSRHLDIPLERLPWFRGEVLALVVQYSVKAHGDSVVHARRERVDTTDHRPAVGENAAGLVPREVRSIGVPTHDEEWLACHCTLVISRLSMIVMPALSRTVNPGAARCSEAQAEMAATTARIGQNGRVDAPTLPPDEGCERRIGGEVLRRQATPRHSTQSTRDGQARWRTALPAAAPWRCGSARHPCVRSLGTFAQMRGSRNTSGPG